jgi:hypothetical protein
MNTFMAKKLLNGKKFILRLNGNTGVKTTIPAAPLVEGQQGLKF